MATLLLIIIYLTFIGLGIPDSLLGAAWPAMYPDIHVAVSAAGWLSILISVLTMISSIYSPRLINKYSTGTITAISTLLTAIGLLGMSYSGNVWWICLFAVPLGLGAGAIDAAINNYVTLNYNAMQVNFLHCFYGIGVTTSPYLMSIALEKSGSWRMGYKYVFIIQIILTAMCFLALPLWRKLEKPLSDFCDKPKTLSIPHMFKMKKARLAFYIFLTSCGLEFICDVWVSTYFVEARAMSSAEAAKIVTVYFIGITVGRLAAGLISKFLNGWQIVFSGLGLVLAAIILIALPLGTKAAILGIFLIGLGNGPLYPNMIQMTPQNFGRNISASIISFEMAGCYVGITCIPPLFGYIAKATSFSIFPYAILFMLILLVSSTVYLKRIVKSENSKTEQVIK